MKLSVDTQQVMDTPWDDVVFVGGHPRAGTTWVSNVLGLAKEANYIFEPLSANREPHCRSPYLKPIQSYMDLPHWFVDSADGDTRLKTVEDALVPHTVWLWRALYGAEEGKTLLVKQPQTERLRWFANAYRARAVIYVKRHPLGVINSYRKLGAMFSSVWRKGSSREMLRQVPDLYPQFSDWLDEADTFSERLALMIHIRYRMVEDVLEDIPHLVVSYEDLCFDSVKGFQRIFDWLDWDWSDEIDSNIRAVTRPEGDKETQIIERVRMPSIRKASETRAFAWLRELSPVVICRVARLYQKLGIDDYPLPGSEALPYPFESAMQGWYRDTRRVVYLWLKRHGIK